MKYVKKLENLQHWRLGRIKIVKKIYLFKDCNLSPQNLQRPVETPSVELEFLKQNQRSNV